MKKRLFHKKAVVRISIAAVLAVFLTTGVFLLALQKPRVTFAPSLRFPVGTRVTVSDVVKEVKNGSLVAPDTLLNSSEQGLVKCTFTLKNLLNVESEREILIEFYEIDPKENPSEPENENTEESGENGNTSPSAPSPFREDGSLIDGSYETENGKTLVISGGIASVDGILLVNKSYPLPKDYDPGGLTEETKAAYDRLLAEATIAEIPLKIDNGFRSWDTQYKLFYGYVESDSLENALTYSARPGHSEHQTGLALDLLLSNSVEATLPENKVILDWLSENAYRYGLILRYPQGKTEITGYIFEPWHYRYVGTELAEILYNGGDWITLEEYFGVDSVYRGY